MPRPNLLLADVFKLQDILELRNWAPQSVMPFLNIAIRVEIRVSGLKSLLRQKKAPDDVFIFDLFNDISQEYNEFTNMVGKFRPGNLDKIQKSITTIKAIVQEKFLTKWNTVEKDKANLLLPLLCFWYAEIHVPTIQNLFKARKGMEGEFLGRFLDNSISGFGMIKESTEKVIGGARII